MSCVGNNPIKSTLVANVPGLSYSAGNAATLICKVPSVLRAEQGLEVRVETWLREGQQMQTVKMMAREFVMP